MTHNFCLGEAGDGEKPSWAQVELRLIQSKKDIEDPKLIIQAYDI